MSFWIKDCHLTGQVVELIPLLAEHKQALIEAASDGQLWKLWYTSVPSPQTIDNTIESALLAKQNNGDHPFVVRHLASNKIIGATRYCHVDNNYHRLEIGYTWYSKSFQRTNVNSECKKLLLTHAFEKLQAIAVEFRTHFMNHASRRAILRLGAKQDGILRNHSRLVDGSYRDTVDFSIIENEWPAVKNNLEQLCRY